MKRVLTVLLALALVSGTLAGCKKTGDLPEPDLPPIEKTDVDLVVACHLGTPVYIPGLYDSEVIDLLYGYSTYVITPDGKVVMDTNVISDLANEYDEEGNRIYTFTIHPDLKWNDGSKITATDYVFIIPVMVSRAYFSTVTLAQPLRQKCAGHWLTWLTATKLSTIWQTV